MRVLNQTRTRGFYSDSIRCEVGILEMLKHVGKKRPSDECKADRLIYLAGASVPDERSMSTKDSASNFEPSELK